MRKSIWTQTKSKACRRRSRTRIRRRMPRSSRTAAEVFYVAGKRMRKKSKLTSFLTSDRSWAHTSTLKFFLMPSSARKKNTYSSCSRGEHWGPEQQKTSLTRTALFTPRLLKWTQSICKREKTRWLEDCCLAHLALMLITKIERNIQKDRTMNCTCWLIVARQETPWSMTRAVPSTLAIPIVIATTVSRSATLTWCDQAEKMTRTMVWKWLSWSKTTMVKLSPRRRRRRRSGKGRGSPRLSLRLSQTMRRLMTGIVLQPRRRIIGMRMTTVTTLTTV